MPLFVDSSPLTDRDYRLDYDGYHGFRSWCRVRVYRPNGRPPVILATNPYEVEDSGTSITNLAELVFRLAWSQEGEPWPADFVEHFVGEPAKDQEEHWALVEFATSKDGVPLLREDLQAGSIVTVTEDLQQVSQSDRVSLEIAFREPK